MIESLVYFNFPENQISQACHRRTVQLFFKRRAKVSEDWYTYPTMNH